MFGVGNPPLFCLSVGKTIPCLSFHLHNKDFHPESCPRPVLGILPAFWQEFVLSWLFSTLQNL